eukprot:1741632-Pleurochrysis_carterae.AAC.2
MIAILSPGQRQRWTLYCITGLHDKRTIDMAALLLVAFDGRVPDRECRSAQSCGQDNGFGSVFAG